MVGGGLVEVGFIDVALPRGGGGGWGWGGEGCHTYFIWIYLVAVNRPGVLGAVLHFALGSLYLFLQIRLSC